MIATSGFDAFFWAFHAEGNFKLFKLSLQDFSFPVRLQTILTEILIIKLCLWSYQQMVEQDLPLVSYGFLTGFRGISDPAAPCTFNTGFRLTRSQVGRVGPLPATHFAKNPLHLMFWTKSLGFNKIEKPLRRSRSIGVLTRWFCDLFMS